MGSEFDQQAMRLFIRAYLRAPQFPGEFSAFTKAQIRTFRDSLIEVCREDNSPAARSIILEAPSTALKTYAEIIRGLNRVHQDIIDRAKGDVA